jgi:drug/metabolite transporter (DMT)-like permease
MTKTVFLAVLAAAVLHAVWNALIRRGTDKQSVMLALTLGNALTGLCVVATRPWPDPQIWVWIAASGLIHTAYQLPMNRETSAASTRLRGAARR